MAGGRESRRAQTRTRMRLLPPRSVFRKTSNPPAAAWEAFPGSRLIPLQSDSDDGIGPLAIVLPSRRARGYEVTRLGLHSGTPRRSTPVRAARPAFSRLSVTSER